MQPTENASAQLPREAWYCASWVILALLVLGSLAVRVAALAYWGTGAIESEGAEYARIAENLRNGVGYIGLATPGPQVNFPPLFPLLIAGASLLTHNYEWAGRLVSLVLGALLPLPVFGVASRLFNRRVGFIAALLTLANPLLINLSFAVLSEGPYATLLMLSIYLVIWALSESSIMAWLLVGGAFGLSYLLRAEASSAFAIAVLFALSGKAANRTIKYKKAIAAIAAFLCFALPEVAFIYRSTTKVLLEGKSTIFFYTARRISDAGTTRGVNYELAGGKDVASTVPNDESGRGWKEKWAFYGIGSNLNATGLAMRSFADVIRETHIAPKDLLFVGKGIVRNLPVLFRWLSSDWLGAPLLPALALLGAVRRPWRGSKSSSRLFVMLLGIIPIIANPFALIPSEPRYCFVFVPLFCVWAGNGLAELGLWIKASSAAAGWRLVARPLVSQGIVPGMIAVVMIVSPVKGVRRVDVFEESATTHRIDKEVGLWIGRQQDRPTRIMDLQIPLAYHAGAQFTHFPYCTGESALRYLDAAGVDYIILRQGESFTGYYDDWLKHGIPDSRAQLLHVSSHADSEFLVYRWKRANGARSKAELLESGRRIQQTAPA